MDLPGRPPFVENIAPMDRPTRKTTHLERKLAAKQARSRKSGSKAKRWKKTLEQVKAGAPE